MPKTITSLTPYTGEDVKKVRKKTGVSQNLFALAIGVTPMAVRNWEQGRVNPSGPVTRLLDIIEEDDGVLEYYLRKR